VWLDIRAAPWYASIMRARKLAVAEPEDPPSPDVADAWPADEEPALPRSADPGPLAAFCLECATEGCLEHGETVRLDAPSRAMHEAVARLRRAGAEQRAAARTLRLLVLSEVARGRGDLETRPAPQVEPCPRCLIRDAEAAAAADGVTRGTARKAKRESGQQTLPFKAS
jgi:hypothetical protein